MKIGIPNALLYYNYRHLWTEFFNQLGQDVIVSPPSNAAILKNGVSGSIDECCLSFKLFMGHADYLKDKCDYILAPRVDNFGKNENVCVKFNALPDTVRNVFDMRVLDYDIDVERRRTEQKGFIKMGRELGFSAFRSLFAYRQAKKLQDYSDNMDALKEEKRLKGDGLKIMLVGHPYNCHDALIGAPIADFIVKQGAQTVYADKFCGGDCNKIARNYSPTLKWTFNKRLVGAIGLYKDYVDGIIFITSFPCGPDSLINELMLRKIKDVPVCNIIVDELQAENGLHTRLESFLDIISARKGGVAYAK